MSIGHKLSIEVEVREGLDFIFFHCRNQPRYPRRIRTRDEPRQWTVYSDEEVLERFAKAGYVDCYISLYPHNQESPLTPDVVYIDQDDRSKKDFVLGRIEQVFGGGGRGNVKVKVKPTVLDSGGGLSIILPIDITEFLKAFQPLSALKPVKKILKFCAQELSWGEADVGHSPSVNNCLVRVPGSINSKNGARVRVLQEWNGYRPSLLPLWRPFLSHLMMEDTRREQEPSFRPASGRIDWIEKLLQRSIYSGRACAIERIFCPYLIRRMSKKEALIIIEDWLARCLALPGAKPMDSSKRYDGYIEYYLDWAQV